MIALDSAANRSVPITRGVGFPTGVTEAGDASHAVCGRYPWVCVWSRPMMEGVAARGLAAEGFKPYLPLHEVRDRRGQAVTEPAFRRYLFARMRDGQWVDMLSVRGVAGLIRNPLGVPQWVPEAIVDAIRRRADPDGVMRPRAPGIGDEVRVVGTDLLGTCCRRDDTRAWLLLTILGKATPTPFPLSAVEIA